MQRITVDLGDRAYEVLVGGGLIDEAGRYLAPLCSGGRAIVVTDETVAEHWLGPIKNAVERAGIAVEAITIPPGEASKSWARLEQLVERLLALEISRDEPVIALGGGVVGDLAGFAAAIAKRGCPLIQIPTSLLAQVDSSVGGKTAINGRLGKNMIGAFHQPALVLADPEVLITLPAREMRAGYAELVKYGLIGDADFFAWCEAHGERILACDISTLEQAIGYCVAAKAKIVGSDERDRTGNRALLNLGHSFAHAIETESEFAMLHGEAVAIGIALAFRYSERRGHCTAGDVARVSGHLGAVALPTSLPRGTSGTALAAHMRQDKKSSAGSLTLILARGIGEAFVEPYVDKADVAGFLKDELRRR